MFKGLSTEVADGRKFIREADRYSSLTVTAVNNASTTPSRFVVTLKETSNENPESQNGLSVQQYKTAIFRGRSRENDAFTIIMQTYKREKTLPNLLLHYCWARYLSKIVVIWNDVGVEIPENILRVKRLCPVPIVFIEETVNKMTNRYKPRPEIETDCECMHLSK